MAEFINGADFNGDLPDSRADAMESGSLWDFAHMYDVVRESRAAKTNVETVDEELHDHEKVKATADTLGHVKVGDNIAVTNDGTISTDVNKAYVDKLISEIPKTAIYFIQRNPLDFTINGNSYNGISSSMGVISDNNNNIMSGYIEIEGVSGNYSAGDSITIGISGFHFFGPYTTFTTDSAYITGLYYNSSDGGNTLIGSITKDTTNIPDFSIFVNTLSNRFIAKDGLAGFVKPSTSITAASDGTIKINPSIFSDGLTATDAQVSVDTAFVANAIAGDGLKVINDGLAVNCGSGLIINDDKIQYESPILSWADTFPDGTFTISDGASIDSAICITSKGSTYLFKVVINFITSAAFTTGTKITIKMSGYNIKMCCLGVCGVGDVTISDTELTLTFKQDVAVNTAVKVVVL